MKVIFLDVDGVLNNTEDFRTNWQITPDHLNNLKAIVDATEAKIVLSSAWKNVYTSRAKVVRALESVGLEIYDDTPAKGVDRFTHCGAKVVEIASYLEDHPEVTNYVILDDRSFPEEMENHHVKTTLGIGLLEEHANQAIEILNQ